MSGEELQAKAIDPETSLSTNYSALDSESDLALEQVPFYSLICPLSIDASRHVILTGGK
jgi:hypothetical protein